MDYGSASLLEAQKRFSSRQGAIRRLGVNISSSRRTYQDASYLGCVKCVDLQVKGSEDTAFTQELVADWVARPAAGIDHTLQCRGLLGSGP
uniref:Uncharacterized protein n=1 Tax=Pyricularia oryzae (strain P131) TaxID=1143193 RepID=L7J506_PYRO1